jgi:hypothetical protein
MASIDRLLHIGLPDFPFLPTLQNPANAGGLKVPRRKNTYHVKFVDATDESEFGLIAREGVLVSWTSFLLATLLCTHLNWSEIADMLEFMSNLEVYKAAS